MSLFRVAYKDRQEHNCPDRQRHPRRTNRLQTGISLVGWANFTHANFDLRKSIVFWLFIQIV